MTTDWSNYLKNEELKYKKLGCVICPAFNYEDVYFNNYGLHHLIYKGEKLRTKNEIMRRFKLLPYVLNILKKIKSVDDEERRSREKSFAYFWTIKYKVSDDLKLRIIVRRLNNGTLHFFSVMSE